MPRMYEVRQYNISRIIEDKQFDTAKDAYKLLTTEELRDPYCVYENVDKKDNYKFGGFDNKKEFIKRINKIDDEHCPLICIQLRINIDTGSTKILDYWFEL